MRNVLRLPYQQRRLRLTLRRLPLVRRTLKFVLKSRKFVLNDPQTIEIGAHQAPQANRLRLTRLSRRLAQTDANGTLFRSAFPNHHRSRYSVSSNSLDSGHLKAFIERIERLEEEKQALAEDIKDVYAEAKGTGYDVKILRKIVTLRRQDSNKRREEDEILDLYMSALGMS